MADFTTELSSVEMQEYNDKLSKKITDFDSNSYMYSSFIPTDKAGKIKLVNVTGSDTLPVMENLKKPISMCDVVITPAEITRDTGEVRVCPRCCIIDKDDKVYSATSWGLYRSLLQINNIFGTLHFEPDDPLVIEAYSVKTKNGKTIHLKLI